MFKIFKIICLCLIFLIPFNVYAETKKVSVSVRIKYDGDLMVIVQNTLADNLTFI